MNKAKKFFLWFSGILVVGCGTGGLLLSRHIDFLGASAELPKAFEVAKKAGVPLELKDLQAAGVTYGDKKSLACLQPFGMHGDLKEAATIYSNLTSIKPEWDTASEKLEAYQSALAAIRPNARRGTVLPFYDLDADQLSLFPTASGMQMAVRAFCADAILAARNGDFVRAAGELESARDLSSSVVRQPTLNGVHPDSVRRNHLPGRRICLEYASKNLAAIRLLEKALRLRPFENLGIDLHRRHERVSPRGGPSEGSLVEDNGNETGTIREFDEDGNAIRDYDFGHDHTGVGDPHGHDWDWSQSPPRGKPRPIRPNERWPPREE